MAPPSHFLFFPLFLFFSFFPIYSPSFLCGLTSGQTPFPKSESTFGLYCYRVISGVFWPSQSTGQSLWLRLFRGAVGPHRGSQKLFNLVNSRLAQLAYPASPIPSRKNHNEGSARAFPSLFLPNSGAPPMWPRVAWCAPFSWELYVINLFKRQLSSCLSLSTTETNSRYVCMYVCMYAHNTFASIFICIPFCWKLWVHNSTFSSIQQSSL